MKEMRSEGSERQRDDVSKVLVANVDAPDENTITDSGSKSGSNSRQGLENCQIQGSGRRMKRDTKEGEAANANKPSARSKDKELEKKSKKAHLKTSRATNETGENRGKKTARLDGECIS